MPLAPPPPVIETGEPTQMGDELAVDVALAGVAFLYVITPEVPIQPEAGILLDDMFNEVADPEFQVVRLLKAAPALGVAQYPFEFPPFTQLNI